MIFCGHLNVPMSVYVHTNSHTPKYNWSLQTAWQMMTGNKQDNFIIELGQNMIKQSFKH